MIRKNIYIIILFIAFVLSGTNCKAGSPAFTSIDCGSMHSMALMSNGTVWAWGDNRWGQLGNGNNNSTFFPVQAIISNITSISAGGAHTLALKDDGTVWAWGDNCYGQLGIGTQDNDPHVLPVQVKNLNNIIAIDSGATFNIALKDDGTVWAWGNNYEYQLGDGSNINKNIPVQVQGLLNVEKIICGDFYSIALKSDGTVWAWGDNERGQLCDGTYEDKKIAIKAGINDIKEIFAGHSHIFSIKNNGTIWAWGGHPTSNIIFFENNPSTTARPIIINGLTEIKKIGVGQSHCIILKNDCTVWSWGNNNVGQLGDGTFSDKTDPVKINGLNNITDISTGAAHNIAIDNDGNLWAWGNNQYGQLGDGTITNEKRCFGKNNPVKVLLNIDNTPIFDTTPLPSENQNKETRNERSDHMQILGLIGLITTIGITIYIFIKNK